MITKNELNMTIHAVLNEKYTHVLSDGDLFGNNFVYLKPNNIDAILKKIFFNFVCLTNFKRILLNKKYGTKWCLSPYFAENSPFSNPIGAHIVVANARELKETGLELEDFSKVYDETSESDRQILITGIEKVNPPNWKTIRSKKILNLDCRALNITREENDLPEKVDDRFDFHLTFAVKFFKTKIEFQPRCKRKVINQMIHKILENKYQNAFHEGVLGTGRILYFKPKFIDEITRSIFKDYKKLVNKTRQMLQKQGKTLWKLPPYFAENSPFSNPIGAHITVVNVQELKQHKISSRNIVEVYENCSAIKKQIEIIGIEKVVPPNWKAVKCLKILTLKCPALTEARLNNGLSEKVDNQFEFHLTFAAKFQN